MDQRKSLRSLAQPGAGRGVCRAILQTWRRVLVAPHEKCRFDKAKALEKLGAEVVESTSTTWRA